MRKTKNVKDKVNKEMKEFKDKIQKKESIQLYLWDIIKSSDATLDAAEELKPTGYGGINMKITKSVEDKLLKEMEEIQEKINMKITKSNKEKIVKEMKEIQEKSEDEEYDMGMLAEEYPYFDVLFEEINNEIGSVEEESEKIMMERYGKYRIVGGQLKLFCNNIGFRDLVLEYVYVYIKRLGMRDTHKAFNRALYLSYIRYIAGWLGFDVLHDDRVP